MRAFLRGVDWAAHAATVVAIVKAFLVGALVVAAGCAPTSASKACEVRAATHVACTQCAQSTAGPCPFLPTPEESETP